MKSVVYKIVSTLLFLAIVAGLLSVASNVAMPFLATKLERNLHNSTDKNTIDIAFVGSSTTYRYYDLMSIWEEYGLTSAVYFSPDVPFEFTTYMIEYAQQRQTPQLYVVELRSVLENEFSIRYFGEHETALYQESYASALDLLPNALSRVQPVLSSPYYGDAAYQQIFKILYNHEGFLGGLNSREQEPLAFEGNQMMLYRTEDLSADYVDFSTLEESEYELTEETKARLMELFSYCKENNLNVYFTFTPYVDARNPQDENIRREIGEMVRENGFPFADFRAEFEEIGADPATDFYNVSHMNAMGAAIYTPYAMERFLQTYDIEPNHDEETIENWNAQWARWEEFNAQQLALLNG